MDLQARQSIKSDGTNAAAAAAADDDDDVGVNRIGNSFSADSSSLTFLVPIARKNRVKTAR